MDKLVTKKSLQEMLDSEDTDYLDKVIGRALVGIFNRQTKNEQETNDTNTYNNIGFTGADARSGSISAKFYLKHRRFEDWQRGLWLKKNAKGFSRLAKYWKQLNEIANEKRGTV